MSMVACLCIMLFGRVVYSVPAVLGFLLAFLFLTDLELSTGMSILVLLAVSGISIIAVSALALLSHYSGNRPVPAAWLAAASVGGFLIFLQDDVFFQGIEVLGLLQPESNEPLVLPLIRMVNAIFFAAGALSLLFCALLLVIELPFVLGTRLSGIVTPTLIPALRTVVLFFAITLSLDLIVSFLLREWPLAVLLAT